MAQFGFVYLLTNAYMPDVYKIGCTERSPHARAAELSAPTGVPYPFDVTAYIEVEDFQAVERTLHKACAEYRISNNREFFSYGADWAIRLMYFYPDKLSGYFNQARVEELLRHGEFGCLEDMSNPFERSPASPPALDEPAANDESAPKQSIEAA